MNIKIWENKKEEILVMLVDTELRFGKNVLSLYIKAVIKICNGEVS